MKQRSTGAELAIAAAIGPLAGVATFFVWLCAGLLLDPAEGIAPLVGMATVPIAFGVGGYLSGWVAKRVISQSHRVVKILLLTPAAWLAVGVLICSTAEPDQFGNNTFLIVPTLCPSLVLTAVGFWKWRKAEGPSA